MPKQYNVAIFYDNEEAKGRVLTHSQRVLPFDVSGNCLGWTFSSEDLKYVGKFLVFKSINESSANIAHREFGELEGIFVRPVHISELDYFNRYKR